MVFIPKGAGGALEYAAAPQDFRPIMMSKAAHKVVAKALNVTLEKIAQKSVHPSQRGFVAGRHFLQGVFDVMGVMHRSCHFPAPWAGVTLLDIKAAFPSALRGWIWRVLDHLGAPPWVATALQALYFHSSAMVASNGVLTEATFFIGRGIKQGCASSSSVWALLFDPIVRRLTALVSAPRAVIAALADDLAAAFFNSVSGLRTKCAPRQAYPSPTQSASW